LSSKCRIWSGDFILDDPVPSGGREPWPWSEPGDSSPAVLT
jgi:hypothetical protein